MQNKGLTFGFILDPHYTLASWAERLPNKFDHIISYSTQETECNGISRTFKETESTSAKITFQNPKKTSVFNLNSIKTSFYFWFKWIMPSNLSFRTGWSI